MARHSTWSNVDDAMAQFMQACDVAPSELIGKVSDTSMHAWFGFGDSGNHGSVVYFVRCLDRGVVKIGYTRHLKKRLGHIQHYSIDPIRFEAAMPGTRETERALHERFAESRTVGEWFFTSDELEAVIRQVADAYPQPADLMVGLTT